MGPGLPHRVTASEPLVPVPAHVDSDSNSLADAAADLERRESEVDGEHRSANLSLRNKNDAEAIQIATHVQLMDARDAESSVSERAAPGRHRARAQPAMTATADLGTCPRVAQSDAAEERATGMRTAYAAGHEARMQDAQAAAAASIWPSRGRQCGQHP